MSKLYTTSKQQRSNFIAQMNRKWQQKHEREEAWLNRIDEYVDSRSEDIGSSKQGYIL